MNYAGTAHLAPSQQQALWSSLICKHVCGEQREHMAKHGVVHALGRGKEAGFVGTLEFADLDDVHLCRIRADAHVFRGKVPPSDALVLFQLAGRTRVTQDGRSALLRPGEWLVMLAPQAGVRTVENETSVDQLLVYLPGARAPESEAALFQAFASTHGLGRLTYEFAVTTFDVLADLDDSSAYVADKLSDLVKRTFAARSCGAAPARSHVDADDIRLFIERNAHDTRLSLEWIAHNFSCSKRTVQRRFEVAYGEGVARYIWRARLEQCARGLTTCSSLTELAASYGFGSSAHFSRAFREQYGVSPSALRRQLLKLGRVASGARLPSDG